MIRAFFPCMVVACAFTSTACFVGVSFDEFDTQAEVDRRPVVVEVGLAGALVLFHDASGAVVDQQRTSSVGLATSTRNISAVTVELTADRLVTIDGITMGDRIVMDGERALGGRPAAFDSWTVRVPIYGRADDEETSYSVGTFENVVFQNGRRHPDPLDLAIPIRRSELADDGKVTFHARAVNGSDERCILARLSASGVPGVPAELPNDWQRPLTAIVATADGSPAKLDLQGVVEGRLGPSGCEEREFWPWNPPSSSMRFLVHPALVPDVVASAWNVDAAGRPTIMARHRGPFVRGEQLVVDLAVPPLTARALTDGTLGVTWEGGPTPVAGVVVTLENGARRWVVIAPAASTTVRVPKLPPQLDTDLSWATAPVTGSVEVTGGDAMTSYSHFRSYWAGGPPPIGATYSATRSIE